RAEGTGHRRALADARFPEGALAGLSSEDPRRALLSMPSLPARARRDDDAIERISIDAIRRFLECPIQGHARLAIGIDRDAPDASAEDEPFEVARLERERVLIDVFLGALEGDDAQLLERYEERIAQSAAHGSWPIGPLAELRRDADRIDLAAWRRAFSRWDPGTRLHRWRFGSSAAAPTERASDVVDRPHEPVSIAFARAPSGEASTGASSIDVIGATRWLLPSGDALSPTTSSMLEGDGERAKVERLKHALRAFVDHAVISAAGLAGSGVRRAWVLDRSQDGPLVIQLAPMRKEAASRWLAGVLDDLRSGPHGLFLPCEAVLRADTLFTRGSDNPSEELARSIEQVRTKSQWQGGSSRFGPVRDAIEHPAPEPARALAIAGRRFRTFFEHLRGVRRAT
nr:hypothetical protein [Myxococcota bacterium]